MKKYLPQLFVSFFLGAALMLTGCQTQKLSETERFVRSVRHELPFHVDSIQYVSTSDYVELRFSNNGYVAKAPDAEINLEGKIDIYRNTIL